ncbi:MAG: SDR family NAD(P)-dependent oxidoreductase [Chitinophagaceae bacterium]|nr:SDR family NAD(P)-dependent oxidoreductase [Chitinophagaceae bacterium]
MHNKKYCLITGASEGFGKALALECASRKMNLVLVALPGPELYYLAGFIKNNYKVDVVAIEKDLSLEENCVQLFKEVQQLGLPVNMLINNAGLGSTMLFHEGSIAFYQKQIRLNIMATTLITHLFLDELRANGPSYIMNVGSLCSYFFLAKKQVYGATKSFIYFFSKSLRRELKQDNIHISVVCPGGMNTNVSVTLLAKSAGWLSRQSVMNPEDVAPVAINGLLKRKEVIIPGN